MVLFICVGSCPPDAAASLVEGINCISLGEVAEGPRWENGISTLKYINGELCPDKIRRKTTILRLKCDESKIVSRLLLLGFILCELFLPLCVGRMVKQFLAVPYSSAICETAL